MALAAFKEFQIGEAAYGASTGHDPDPSAVQFTPKNLMLDARGRFPRGFVSEELGFGEGQGPSLAKVLALTADGTHNAAARAQADKAHRAEDRKLTDAELKSWQQSRAEWLKRKKRHADRKRLQAKRARAA